MMDIEALMKPNSPPNVLQLPDELLLRIFSHLNYDSLEKCDHVCRRFRKISNDHSLYRDIKVRATSQATLEDNINSFRKILPKIKSPRKLDFGESGGFAFTFVFMDILPELKKWHNLKELTLVSADMHSVEELPLEKLSLIRLIFCKINHKTLSGLLKSNEKLILVELECNFCFCNECEYFSFAISLSDLEPSASHIQELTLKVSSMVEEDFNIISNFTSMKRLALETLWQQDNIDIAATEFKTKKGVKWHLAVRLPEITIVDGIPVKEGEQPLETFEYGPFSNTEIVRLVELGGQWKLMIKCSEIDGELQVAGTTIVEVAPGIYYLPIMRDEQYENTILQVLGLQPIHKNDDTSTVEEEEERLRRVLELVDTTK